MKKISLLGSTGSIGEQTLDVVAGHRDRFDVVAIAAGRRVDRLIEQARELIRNYSWRWKIEELNRALKKEGLQIEDSQHETGAALRRLAIMSLSVALTVMQLVSARDGEQERPASMAFDQQQLECLEQIGPRYEGQTLQQQNPFTPHTLAWAAWIIGRLGGWKGYRRAGPAGPITMKRGLQKFGAMFEAWSLARELQPGERN